MVLPATSSSPVDYGPAPGSEHTERIWDVCVIGSGAAGSMVAHELVRRGHEVLMLEQGGFLRPSSTYDQVLRASEPAYGRMANGCWGLVGYPWTTCNVGGGTVFYGGASFRYREVDFDAGRHFPDADLPVAWPYPYAELAPYYDEVEALLEVAADPGLDPTEPPSGHVCAPPVPRSESGDHIWKAARRLGLHPFPTPLAIRSVDRPEGPACDRLSPCIEHVCPSGAKRDALRAVLAPLLEAEGLTLLAGLKVVALRRGRRARVDEVEALRVDTGERVAFKARWVVVAANAIQSAGLLLRSQDRWSPTGLGNEHDLVGRGLCFKLNEYVGGFLDGETAGPSSGEQGGPFSTVTILDHYLDEGCPTGMGGMIYETRPGFSFSMGSGCVVRLETMLADQPSRENRIHLARETDSFGVPRLVIDYRPHPRDMARLHHMAERCSEILREAGCRAIEREATDFHLGSCHLHGTCRGHDDPRFGVLDRWSRVHSVDNVFVVDGAFIPFPSALNPTLTIQAHALRSARFLAESCL